MDRPAALAQAVLAQGGPRLAAVEWHAAIGSTNDRLKELARGGAPEWTVVAADAQTAGRGREGRVWQSPPGGLYLSVLLRPGAAPAPLLPLAAGVAVAEALAGLGAACTLKWPNDVLASGRKLAGILAEASSSAAGVEWVALGIGVNVALDLDALPGDLRGAVTSLHAEGGSAPPLAVAASVLACVGAWYGVLVAEPQRVVGAWRERAAAWWGAIVDVRSGGVALRGKLVAVDDLGALVVELPDGETRRLVAGEVQMLRPLAGA